MRNRQKPKATLMLWPTMYLENLVSKDAFYTRRWGLTHLGALVLMYTKLDINAAKLPTEIMNPSTMALT